MATSEWEVLMLSDGFLRFMVQFFTVVIWIEVCYLTCYRRFICHGIHRWVGWCSYDGMSDEEIWDLELWVVKIVGYRLQTVSFIDIWYVK